MGGHFGDYRDGGAVDPVGAVATADVATVLGKRPRERGQGTVEYVEALGRETFLGVGGIVLHVDGRSAADVGPWLDAMGNGYEQTENHPEYREEKQ